MFVVVDGFEACMKRTKGAHGSEDSTMETLLNDDLLRECHSASDDRQRTKNSATETLLNNDLLHEYHSASDA